LNNYANNAIQTSVSAEVYIKLPTEIKCNACIYNGTSSKTSYATTVSPLTMNPSSLITLTVSSGTLLE
jgi:hypothetical protein